MKDGELTVVEIGEGWEEGEPRGYKEVVIAARSHEALALLSLPDRGIASIPRVSSTFS